MASIIDNCLARLVRTGRITQKAADAAKALHDGMQGRLGQTIPPSSADAVAALEAAKAMAAAAKHRKYKAAKKAIALQAGQERMAAHPRGKSAGLAAMSAPDPWGTPGGANVERLAETILGKLHRMANGFLEDYKSKAFGLKQDIAGLRNVMRERFGNDTGDAAAKANWKGWQEASEYAVKHYRLAGGDVTPLEDWGTPQEWTRSQIKGYEDEYAKQMLQEAEAGGMTVLDVETGLPAPAANRLDIIRKAADDIVHGRRIGAGNGFNRHMRVFRFNNFDSWSRMMDRWGTGRGGVYSMMVGHLRGVAREIALTEVFGPGHRAQFNALHQEAVRDAPKGLIARTVTGPRAAELAYKTVTGELSSAQSDKVAGIFGGLRNIKTASSLLSAIVSAVPGDTVTMMWAAMWNGVPVGRVVSRAIRIMASEGAEGRAAAARTNLIIHGTMDATLGIKRFEDQVMGENFAGRLASTLIRASGLAAWTEALKRAFAMEFLGMIADQSRFAWGNLDRRFRRFLQRYGFSEGEWDQLRATPLLDIEGATFFDADAAGPLGDRLMSAVLDERGYAVIEPTALTRAISTGGTQRGTIPGELWRSSFMFKSFAVTILLTHVMRTLSEGPYWNRAFRFAAFMATMTAGGALALQAKQIIAGRDPKDMTQGSFFVDALAQGGGLGIYGDFIYSSINRGGQGLLSTLAGPVIGEVGGTVDLVRKLFSSGGGKSKGEALADYLQRWTPGSTLWYARAAVDRILFDFLIRMTDPNAASTFRRQQRDMQRDFGQGFWYAPGDVLPSRAPNLGAAFGQ